MINLILKGLTYELIAHPLGVDRSKFSRGWDNIATSLYIGKPLTNTNKITFKKMICSQSHVIGVDIDGKIWTWGNNGFGQLGINSTIIYVSSPTLLTESEKFKKIACGSHHRMALGFDDTLWSWGLDINGQLGNSKRSEHAHRGYPCQVQTSNKFDKIFCGCEQSFAITKDGSTFACGCNRCGELGTGSNLTSVASLELIKGDIKFKKISSYDNVTFGFTFDGKVYAWGNNQNEELGIESTKSRSWSDDNYIDIPILVKYSDKINFRDIIYRCSRTFGISKEGQLYIWGYGEKEMRKINNYIIKTIMFGKFDDLAIDSNDELLCWDTKDQTLLKKYKCKAKKIFATSEDAFIVDEDGSMYAYGGNESGGSGFGDNKPRDKLTKTNFMFILKKKNNLKNNFRKLLSIKKIMDVTFLS